MTQTFTMPMTIIEKTKISETDRNGGLEQEIIFTIQNEKNVTRIFKVSIRTDSVDRQAYARLYQWTDGAGFALIIQKNLMSTYGKNPTYCKPGVNHKDFFELVFKDLEKLAYQFC